LVSVRQQAAKEGCGVTKLFLVVKPNARKNEVVQIDKTHFRVSVKAAPDEGRANEAVIKALKEYFDLPKSCFSITRGLRSRNKTVTMSR